MPRLRHVGGPAYGDAMKNTEPMVENEPVRLILEALLPLFESMNDEGDMVRLDGRIGGDSGAALLRALGRITAELHAEDMRSFLPGGARSARTEHQRRADALFVLINRLSEATGINASPLPMSC